MIVCVRTFRLFFRFSPSGFRAPFQALKAGADEVLQSMDQLEQETLYKWYVSRVQVCFFDLHYQYHIPVEPVPGDSFI